MHANIRGTCMFFFCFACRPFRKGIILDLLVSFFFHFEHSPGLFANAEHPRGESYAHIVCMIESC